MLGQWLQSPQSVFCIPVVPPKEGQVLATKCIALCRGHSALPRFTGLSVWPGCYWPSPCSDCSFCHTPSPWNCQFEYSTLVKINFIIWLNLVNLRWWGKENRFLFTQCVVLFICGPRTVGYLSVGPCLCRQPSASREESPVGGVDGWGLRSGRDSWGCTATCCSLHYSFGN